jgi:hypothetical protein
MGSQRLYTAVDLLEKVIEFEDLTPNPALWKEGLLKDNPPRLLRLRQINALSKALFNHRPAHFLEKAKSIFLLSRIPTVKTLLSGAFVKERNPADYEDVITWMKEVVREKEGELGETGQLKPVHLIEVYQRLLRYKKQAMALEQFNSRNQVKKAVGLRFSVYLTNNVSYQIKESCGPLDKALGLLLDPFHLSFTADELQQTYNYPKEDVKEIDNYFQ